jgi:ribosomal protein S17
MKDKKICVILYNEFKIGDIVRINTVSQISNQGKWVMEPLWMVK